MRILEEQQQQQLKYPEVFKGFSTQLICLEKRSSFHFVNSFGNRYILYSQLKLN